MQCELQWSPAQAPHLPPTPCQGLHQHLAEAQGCLPHNGVTSCSTDHGCSNDGEGWHAKGWDPQLLLCTYDQAAWLGAHQYLQVTQPLGLPHSPALDKLALRSGKCMGLGVRFLRQPHLPSSRPAALPCYCHHLQHCAFRRPPVHTGSFRSMWGPHGSEAGKWNQAPIRENRTS